MSGSSEPWEMAIDIGRLRTKLAVAPPSGAPVFRVAESADGGRADLVTALAAGAELAGGSVGDLCFAIPDAWMAGTTAGARAAGQFKHAMAGLASGSIRRTRFVGQLAAVAAVTAWRRDFKLPGRYLICDVGGLGVRAALVCVVDRNVRLLAAHETTGGGWRDFDAAVRDTLPADDEQVRDHWFQAVAARRERAAAVLDRAFHSPGYAGSRVAVITGAHGPCELTAGQLITSFQPTAAAVREAVTAVLGNAPPDLAVVAGGLAEFPLASRAVADAAEVAPDRADPHATAHGALLLMRGEACMPEPDPPPVSLPMHQIRNGLLGELSRPLPWLELPAEPDGEPLRITGPHLIVDVAGRRTPIATEGLAPGPYRIAIYRTWSGRGLLGVLPEHPEPGEPATFYPLDEPEPGDE